MGAVDDLALQALATPALGAADALEVLLDALLEAGTWTDDASPGAEALRRRAFLWARRRHTTAPTATELVAAVLVPVLVAGDFPHAVLGIVGPFVLRVHFTIPVEAHVLDAARRALADRLPGPVTVEVTARARER